MKRKMKKLAVAAVLSAFLLMAPGTSNKVFAQQNNSNATIMSCKSERDNCLKNSQSDVGEAMCWVDYAGCLIRAMFK